MPRYTSPPIRRACAGAAIFLLGLLISSCDRSGPPDTSPAIEDVLNQVSEQGFAVGIVGNAGDAYLSSELPGQRQTTTLDDFVSTDVSSVWFSHDATDDALTSGYLPQLEQAMRDGKSLVFIGLDDPNRLRTLFGLPLEYSVGPDPSIPDAVYAWEMTDPQTDGPLIAMGLIFQPENASEIDTARQVLVQSYQHSGNINRNFQQWPAVPNKGASMRIGENWKLTFGPTEYNWAAPDCGGCTLNEYKSGWSLAPGQDNDYYAMSLDEAVTGSPGSAVEDLAVKSDADEYLEPGAPDQHLYLSGPESVHESGTTYTFDISSGFPETADQFRVSWNSLIEDAIFLDNSDWSREYFGGEWDYDEGSDYAQSISYQYLAFSYRVEKGSGEAWMHNFRKAEWEHGSDAAVGGEFLTQVPAGS